MNVSDEDFRICDSDNSHASQQDEHSVKIKSQFVQVLGKQKQLLLQLQEKAKIIEILTAKLDKVTTVIINQKHSNQ